MNINWFKVMIMWYFLFWVIQSLRLFKISTKYIDLLESSYRICINLSNIVDGVDVWLTASSCTKLILWLWWPSSSLMMPCLPLPPFSEHLPGPPPQPPSILTAHCSHVASKLSARRQVVSSVKMLPCNESNLCLHSKMYVFIYHPSVFSKPTILWGQS